MIYDEELYITHCKHLIEERLGWQNSSQWKQRDYLNLIDLMEKKTGTTLSLSTVKRIWKPDYKGTPHPTTLEAFARFLDYSSWLDLKAAHPSGITKTELSAPKKRLVHKSKKAIAFLAPVLVLAIASVVFIHFNQVTKQPGGISFHPQEVMFSANSAVADGVPNTIIFNYDVSKVKADSFFIQQSWNRFRRDIALPENSTLTSVYYYPGVHRAKLIGNDSVLKEALVRVNTKGWLSVARYGFMDDMPTYIRNDDLVQSGVLKVTKSHLLMNKVEINSNTMVSYYYVNNFKEVSSGNFSLETKLRSDSIFNLTCPGISIMILGEDGFHSISLTDKGCVGNLSIKFGDTIKNGKSYDLSAFGVNVYDWHLVKINVRNNVAVVYLDKNEIFEVPFTEDVGEIVGFNINFSGSGALDYLELYDQKNKGRVYRHDFDG